MRAFYSSHLSQFAYVMKFNHPILIFAMAVNTISTFIWSYINLFVILVSITLATRFKQINDFLGMYKGKVESNHKYILIDFIDDPCVFSCRLCLKSFGSIREVITGI